MGSARRHVLIIVGDHLNDFTRDSELPTRLVAHARCTRHVAGVVEGNHAVIVLGFIHFDDTALEQVMRDFANMRRLRIVVVELGLQLAGKLVILRSAVTHTSQRVPEAVGNAPGVAAFAHHDAFNTQIQRSIANTQRALAHVFVAANKQAKITGFGSLA